MYIIEPLLLTALVSFVTAIALWLFFRKRSARLQAIAFGSGVLAGALGTQVFMLPLNYCALESEGRGFVDYLLAGILVLVGAAILLALAYWCISHVSSGESLTPRAASYRGAFGGRFAPLFALVFLLPTLVILSVFHYYPLFSSFRLSTRLTRLGAKRTKFVCLDNFSNIFETPEYWYTLFFTIVITIGITITVMLFALLVAQMVSLPIRGANFYRALLIWPIAISPVVSGILFQLLLNRYTGLVNHILDLLFGVQVNWLGNSVMATVSIIMTAAWNQTGFNILFYIAGLKNISHEFIEAAYIDGATPWQAFTRITLPLLSPFTFFLIVTNTIYAFFTTFGVIDVLTKGGPVNATTSAMYRVYQIGIQGKDLGKGAAQSLVLFLIIIGITIVQFRSNRNDVSYGG